jgi:hypothetical protein
MKNKSRIIVVPFLKVAGMALYPFILVQHKDLLKDELLIRHESIHLRQEAELLIIPFYLLYLASYLFNLIKYKNHNQAYMAIYFEREAYANEASRDYLSRRKFWAWRFYLGV